MKKEFPVIEVPSDGKRRWYGGAYCTWFVYSKHNGNFILKGYHDEVEKYAQEHYTHYFYMNTMWCEKRHRGMWQFWKKGVYIIEPSKARKTFRYRVTTFNEPRKELTFKRIPNRWIPEFDNF